MERTSVSHILRGSLWWLRGCGVWHVVTDYSGVCGHVCVENCEILIWPACDRRDKLHLCVK
jgi:hypothetical protein